MEHTAGLVQGIRGAPAPMVKFLLDTSAALIKSIPGQVHDVEGIHDHPRAGKFFSGCALQAGESIHRDDLNALAPRVGLGGQPGIKDPLGSAQNHSQEPRGTTAIMDERHTQDDSDTFARYGVCRHTCSSTPMTHTPSHRAASVSSRRASSAGTAVLAVFQDTPRAWAMRDTVT